MSHYVAGKSVVVTYEISKFNSRKVEEGIGLVRTDHDYFSFVESSRIKNRIGNDNYAKLYNAIKPLDLSSSEGIPMHAVDNGYYYIKCIKKIEEKHPCDDFDNNTVAKHFRLSEKEAKVLIDSVTTKEDMIAFVETQKPRWKREADKAIAIVSDLNHKLDNDLLQIKSIKKQY